MELNARERSRYSICRALLAADRDSRSRDKQSFEIDVSQEIEKKLPGSVERHGGMWIPTSVKRGLDTTATGKGNELVFTRPGSLIDALRNRAVVIALGARLLEGLQGFGSVGMPKLGSSAEAKWVPENPGIDADESSPSTDLVYLRPQTLVAKTTFTRQLLVQSIPAVDGLVIDDLAKVNALSLDRAAIHGPGVQNEPTGIYSLDANIVDFAGPVTFAKVVEMEKSIAKANAETGPMAYVTTPEVRAQAKLTPELPAQISPRMWRDGQMNDRAAEATNQISKTLGGGSEHGIVVGCWEELIIGEWGALETIVNPFKHSLRGALEVTTFLIAGIAFRHIEAFSKGEGLTVS